MMAVPVPPITVTEEGNNINSSNTKRTAELQKMERQFMVLQKRRDLKQQQQHPPPPQYESEERYYVNENGILPAGATIKDPESQSFNIITDSDESRKNPTIEDAWNDSISASDVHESWKNRSDEEELTNTNILYNTNDGIAQYIYIYNILYNI